MKYLFIFFTPMFLVFHTETKYVFLCNQNLSSIHSPISEKGFWADSIHFDTIIIQGERMIEVFTKELTDLKAVKERSIAQARFSITNAIIRFKGNTPKDTLYASRDFYYWKINGQLYEDKKSFFQKRFSGLNHLKIE